VTTVVAPRRSNYQVGSFHDFPSQITVMIWWLITPMVHHPSGLWWFTMPPEVRPVRFRVIIVKRMWKNTRRARVDLAYPIDEIPGGLGEKDLSRLRNALTEAIQKAVPEWEIAVWRQERIDPVCRHSE